MGAFLNGKFIWDSSVINPIYLGKVDNQYRYSGTLIQVPFKPLGW
jgi:hypothetical protein